MRPTGIVVISVACALVGCILWDYISWDRKHKDQAVIDAAVNHALDKPGLREPRLGDLTPKGLKHRMIEDQLRVTRFGRVSHTKDGKTEEYWQAQVVDTESRAIFFIRCDPETEAKWNEFFAELKEKNFRWKVAPLSKEAIRNGWGEHWSIPLPGDK